MSNDLAAASSSMIDGSAIEYVTDEPDRLRSPHRARRRTASCCDRCEDSNPTNGDQFSDGAISVAQDLEDPHSSGMAECLEQLGLDLRQRPARRVSKSRMFH